QRGRLGARTAGATGCASRPGAGGARVAAVRLTIAPQQAQRDQGFVRQVHATQNVGRQVVTEQRAFRRANPGLNSRGNQPAQPGPARQNGLPGQNRPGVQQPGLPKQPGAPKQPGTPKQPGAPKQQGTPGRQGLEQRPGGAAQPAGEPPPPGQNAQPGAPAQAA